MSCNAALQCIVSFPEAAVSQETQPEVEPPGRNPPATFSPLLPDRPTVLPPGVASDGRCGNRGQLCDGFASAGDAVDARFANQSVRRVRSSPCPCHRKFSNGSGPST